MISSVLKKLFPFLREKKKFSNHGRNFLSNSLIDTLFPDLVCIGDDFISAPGSIILAHDASPFIHTHKYRVQEVIIGDRVFLGANSIILPGVTIGNDVIVGAGSVVTKSVPNGVVVAGNPARIMCTIEDYFVKCEKNNILIKANEEFINLFVENVHYEMNDIRKLRDHIYRNYSSRKLVIKCKNNTL